MIVALVGYARTGKDTAAEALIADGFERRAFADALRRLAGHLNPVLPDGFTYVEALAFPGYERAKSDVPGFRDFLKNLGDGVRTILGADTWANSALADAYGDIVVTDCRFLNEAAAVRARADVLGVPAVVIRVDRPGVGPESEFEAEVDMIDVDCVVMNGGTVAELHADILACVYERGHRADDRKKAS